MVTGYLDNFYARLGLPQSATQDEIRSAYHAAARRFHPDLNSDSRASEIFLQIQEAYETLSHAAKRAAYDKMLPEDITSPGNIMVNTIYSRDALTHLDSPQLLYVLMNIMAPADIAAAPEKRQPLNLSIVIDNSTSMNGVRLNTVKETVTRLLKMLQPDDILSIVTFNDRAEVIIPATRSRKLNLLEARISIISASGGTEIFKGLQAGYAEVKQHLHPNLSNHLILITDGRTYGDEHLCLDLAREASRDGVTIHSLGIGYEWNDVFLEALTSITGGSLTYAQTPAAIKQFIEDKFGQIQQIYGSNVQLRYRTDQAVELRYAFRLFPDTGAIPIEDELSLGDIPLRQSLSIILELMVNQTAGHSDDLVLLDGSLDFAIPSAAIPNINSRITFSRPIHINPPTNPPPKILVDALSRLSLYRLQEMAQVDLRTGNLERASFRLKNLATQLLTTGEKDLAKTVMLELDYIGTSNSMNQDAQKMIKFGTRALVISEFDKELHP